MIGTKTRRPVVPAARFQRRVVETFDRGPTPGLEGEVKARGLGVGTVDVKLIGVEVAVTLAERFGQVECLDGGPIEALAGLEVGHAKVDVIEQPSLVISHVISRCEQRAR